MTSTANDATASAGPGAEATASAGPRAGTPPSDGSGRAGNGHPASGRRRRVLLVGAWVGVLLLVSVAVSLLGTGRELHGRALDPTNPDPGGARAVAQVIQQRGTTVEVVRSQDQLLATRIDPDTTVFVARTGNLSGHTAQTAARHAAHARRLVLLDPDTSILHGLGLSSGSTTDPGTDLTASCRTGGADLDPADTLSLGDRVYDASRGRGRTSETTVCFPGSSAGTGYYLDVAGAGGRPRLTVLGASAAFSNEHVLEADNAAIALRLLGSSPRLVWYVPDVNDIRAGDTTAPSLLPPWLVPGLLVVAAATLALCLWRGRRLGRLVVEPLPVVVRAVETTESRGRMYRRARDRDRALSVLQVATRTRLAAYLGLPPGSDPPTVAAATAAATGRRYEAVLALLTTARAPRDADLPDLATQLAALEKETRRP